MAKVAKGGILAVLAISHAPEVLFGSGLDMGIFVQLLRTGCDSNDRLNRNIDGFITGKR